MFPCTFIWENDLIVNFSEMTDVYGVKVAIIEYMKTS